MTIATAERTSYLAVGATAQPADMTTGQIARGDTGEVSAQEPEEPPKQPPRAADGPLPSTVWFGPKGPASLERELVGFLGSHNGVAVLQWPRDTDRATHLDELGIPCLWFVHHQENPPTTTREFSAWLPVSADEATIHACLRQLSQAAAHRRAQAPIELDDGGWLRVGEHQIHLAPTACQVARVLIAHLEQAVDDDLLVDDTRPPTPAVVTGPSLCSELLHLDQSVNPLGLEVVPVAEHTHQLRRCRP